MQHIRLTVRHNPDDPSDDLKVAAKLRRDLFAHSPVEIDPDNRACRTQRDNGRNAFFEFVTEYPEEVRRVMRDFGYSDRVAMAVLDEGVSLECARCGGPAGRVTQCPHCGFRDIAKCPRCGHEVARENYIPVSGDIFRCPDCGRHVKLEINPDLFNSDRSLNEPAVLVHDMEV